MGSEQRENEPCLFILVVCATYCSTNCHEAMPSGRCSTYDSIDFHTHRTSSSSLHDWPFHTLRSRSPPPESSVRADEFSSFSLQVECEDGSVRFSLPCLDKYEAIDTESPLGH